MDRKVYDRIYERPQVQSQIQSQTWTEQGHVQSKTAKSRFSYNPEKKPPTTRYYNQGFSGSFKEEFDYSQEVQDARKEKRSDKYDAWTQKQNRVTKKSLQQGPRDYIGAVASSWLTSLGYNVAASEAVATFKGSSAEFYYKMSYEAFLDWLHSPSKGRWLHDHPSIMHSYSMHSGRGSESMEDRLNTMHTENLLEERGDKARMRKKISDYMSKWN